LSHLSELVTDSNERRRGRRRRLKCLGSNRVVGELASEDRESVMKMWFRHSSEKVSHQLVISKAAKLESKGDTIVLMWWLVGTARTKELGFKTYYLVLPDMPWSNGESWPFRWAVARR